MAISGIIRCSRNLGNGKRKLEKNVAAVGTHSRVWSELSTYWVNLVK